MRVKRRHERLRKVGSGSGKRGVGEGIDICDEETVMQLSNRTSKDLIGGDAQAQIARRKKKAGNALILTLEDIARTQTERSLRRERKGIAAGILCGVWLLRKGKGSLGPNGSFTGYKEERRRGSALGRKIRENF